MTWKEWKQFAKKHRLLPKTKQVLFAIAQGMLFPFEFSDAFLFRRGALMRGGLSYVRHLEYEREQRRIRYALAALKRRKFIEMREKGERMVATLTAKGSVEILSFRCRVASRCTAGTSILVIFDIPERERHVRRQLRFFLKECGFRRFQQSVWQCERDVYALINDFLDSSKAKEWVTVLRCLT